MLGSYIIDVHTGEYPQKIASGFDKAFSGLLGASYSPIAYLGQQTVNGTNHAMLATRILTTGVDTKSIALVILNERTDAAGTNISVDEIHPLLSNGGKLGGLSINPTINIPEEAMAAYNRQMGGFVGAQTRPFALVATQLVHGNAYVFAVESTMVVSPAASSGNTKSVALVKVFSDYSGAEYAEILRGRAKAEVLAEPTEKEKLDYAFNWLKAPESGLNHIVLNGAAK